MSKVMALFCADIHLSWNPPVARSAELDWLEAQARPLWQLRELQEKHDCPVVCAGDIFDKHNPSPALINWAIANLPTMFAVPGQHDLPLHSLVDIKKSAYWTLVEAEKIMDIRYPKGHCIIKENCWMWGFPFGTDITKKAKSIGSGSVAVAHSYIWTDKKNYVGASNGTYVTAYIDRLQGYDVAVFGDNHNGFDAVVYGGCKVYNCGCLIRRKRDEREYKPAVGLLCDDGKVERHFLDTSEDKLLEDDEELPLGEEQGLSEFIDGLGGLNAERVGFQDMVRRYVADGKASKGVGAVMLEALEENNHG